MAFRDSPFQALKAPLTWTAAAVALVVGVIALGFLLTDHRTSATAGGYGAARGEFDEVMEPITNVISAPARWIKGAGGGVGGYFFAVSENRSLKQQLTEMQRWRDAAVALKNLNLRYESLLKLHTQPPINMVAARVVSDARGPYSDARLADAGALDGVKIGNPVMSEDGVVGRIVGLSKRASRILLLTDVESRTPVLIDRTNARAILTGDGGPNPKLEFVRGLNSVQDGDTVLTSGDGGLYPRGLPVGVAARDYRGVWRVRLDADRSAIDLVRILLFEDFAQSVDQVALAASTLPTLTPEEQAQLDAAKTAAAKPPPTAPGAPGPKGAVSTVAAAAAVVQSPSPKPKAPSPPKAKVPSPRVAPAAADASVASSTKPPLALKPASPQKKAKAKPATKKPIGAKPKIPKGSYHPDAGGAP